MDGTTTLNGAGQTIAILIDTVPNNSDLTTFWTNTKVAQKLSNITEINVNEVTPLPAASGEETLDVSWTSGIASAAKVRVYAAGSLAFTDLDRAAARQRFAHETQRSHRNLPVHDDAESKLSRSCS